MATTSGTFYWSENEVKEKKKKRKIETRNERETEIKNKRLKEFQKDRNKELTKGVHFPLSRLSVGLHHNYVKFLDPLKKKKNNSPLLL